MIENPLVTVAIAAYNVEKYIKEGMKYVLNQTYTNLEILLVDDGSTDNTSTLCDEIAQQDVRVKVYHKENGGLGSARNVGIDQAKGEFIYFFDVDDSIELNLIEKNVKNALKYDVDLVIFGYYARNCNENFEEAIELQEHLIHSNDDLKKIYAEELLWMKHGNGFAWNKFYRISFLKKYNFHFGTQRIQQDEPFNMQLYLKLKNVYISPDAYYHYVIYSNGNAGSKYLLDKEKIIIDVYDHFIKFYNEWNINNDTVLDYIQNRFVRGMYGVIIVNYYHTDCQLSKCEKKEKIKQILNNSKLKPILNNSYIDKSNIVNMVLTYAFVHGHVQILMLMVDIKRKIKRILKK